MVQAIANWARLTGTVREVRPPGDASPMSELVIQVDRADDVEGFPNLLSETPGQELTVAVKTANPGDLGLEPGASVSVHAQRASPDVVIAQPSGISSA